MTSGAAPERRLRRTPGAPQHHRVRQVDEQAYRSRCAPLGLYDLEILDVSSASPDPTAYRVADGPGDVDRLLVPEPPLADRPGHSPAPASRMVVIAAASRLAVTRRCDAAQFDRAAYGLRRELERAAAAGEVPLALQLTLDTAQLGDVVDRPAVPARDGWLPRRCRRAGCTQVVLAARTQGRPDPQILQRGRSVAQASGRSPRMRSAARPVEVRTAESAGLAAATSRAIGPCPPVASP